MAKKPSMAMAGRAGVAEGAGLQPTSEQSSQQRTRQRAAQPLAPEHPQGVVIEACVLPDRIRLPSNLKRRKICKARSILRPAPSRSTSARLRP